VTRRSKQFLLLVLIIGAAAAGGWYLSRPKPVAVVVEVVNRGLVEETVANTRAGTVMACRRAKLSPSMGGQISRLEVHEGDQVKAGDLLLELWNTDLLAQVDLSIAESNATHASARAACLQAEVSQREAKRLQRLQKSGAVSEDALDKALTEAQARLADCESANASSRVAASRVDVARSNLERTRLIAPFDGVVAEINGELNEYVTPSPPGILTLPVIDLINNSCFYMAAPIDEVDAAKVQLAQPARVSLDAYGQQRFPGKVRRIANYVLDREKQARTVEVEVEFTNPEDARRLLAGYSADVEIILKAHEDTLRIPTEAVLEDDKVYVFLAEEGVLEERTIKTGMSNWDHTEVISGLAEGDQVVTSVDREGVEDGALVELDTDEDK
jgi:HlyD family secretion protein